VCVRSWVVTLAPAGQRGVSRVVELFAGDMRVTMTLIGAKSRAFFTEHADISKREVIVPIAERFGISPSDVETAWHERRFSPTVDAFIEDGHKVGVNGVPAMGWPNRRVLLLTKREYSGSR
jgi:predicted DsbA family dithiol-disulfide isomerase